MQNTSNDTKHRYKLIVCSILIFECDFCFNFNLKLNNLTETTSFYTWPLKVTTYIKVLWTRIPNTVIHVIQSCDARFAIFSSNEIFLGIQFYTKWAFFVLIMNWQP